MKLSFWEDLLVKFFGPVIGTWYVAYLHIRDLWTIILAVFSGGLKTITESGELNIEAMAVLASQGGSALPQSISTLLDALNRRGVTTLLVINGKISPSVKESLKGKVWQIIERPNIGRDYGAYQAGILHLMKHQIVAKRLLVANDSMFFDSNRIDSLLQKAMESQSDFTAGTENHDPVYHVGSFFFSVSEKVQNSNSWRKYWTKYYPSSSRLHAIRWGELEMSIELIQRGKFQPEILFSVNDLAPFVRGMTVLSHAEYAILFPKEFRKLLNDHNLGGPYANQAASIRLSEGLEKIDDLPALFSEAQSKEKLAFNAIFDEVLNDKVLEIVEVRSQIHWGGLLFVKCLSLGMIKKDLAFRGIYDINHFIQAVKAVGYPNMDEIRLETARRGSPVSLQGIKRLLYMLGHI